MDLVVPHSLLPFHIITSSAAPFDYSPMPTDESLALRLQQGHPDALCVLVERHHGPLLGFLYRMTGG